MAKAGAVASRRAVATYALRPQETLLRELWAQGQDFQPLPSQVGPAWGMPGFEALLSEDMSPLGVC